MRHYGGSGALATRMSIYLSLLLLGSCPPPGLHVSSPFPGAFPSPPPRLAGVRGHCASRGQRGSFTARTRGQSPHTLSHWRWISGGAQQTQNICITFVQCWSNVEDVGTTLYKCYTNALYLPLGQHQRRWTDIVEMLYKCFVFAECTMLGQHRKTLNRRCTNVIQMFFVHWACTSRYVLPHILPGNIIHNRHESHLL